jgi:hypothetical protein
MKKILIILSISLFFFIFHKIIVSKVIITSLSKWSEREIIVKKININYFKNEIIFNNLEIRDSKNLKYKNIFEADKIRVKYNFKSLFTDLIKIDYLYFSDTTFFLEVDDKIDLKVDSIATEDDNKKAKDKTKAKKEEKKIYPKKKNDINFFILKTKINNSKAFINTTSKRDEIKLNLSDMTFVKVGNSKKFQHFKDVFKLLIGDLFFRIPDQNLRNIIKKTYKL